VQQTLEHPSSENARPVSGGLPTLDAAEVSLMSQVLPAEKGRVLLLEDDPSFQDVVREFLAESGYTVVAVPNGGEGVRELLNGDFALILCDLQMPGLPGDMFYRAVERIRPELCSRFVFMSGYRGDAAVNEYIQSIGCWLLRKPFPLHDLLALFAFAEVRETLPSACVSNSNQQIGFPARPAANQASAMVPLPRPPMPEHQMVPRLPYPCPTEAPVTWTSNLPASDGDGSRRFSSSWLDLTIILAVVFSFRYLDVQSAAASELAESRALEAEWTVLSPQFQNALATRSKLQRSPSLPAVIAADQAKPRWTSALSDIAIAAGHSVELLELQAREEKGDPGACEVRVHGQVIGALPRLVADRFLQTVTETLTRGAQGRAVETRFERLDDVPAAAAGQQRAAFIATAGISPAKPVEVP
jgi:CheY-like chemotaxis protein